MSSVIERVRGRLGSYRSRAKSRVQQAWRRALLVRATDWTASTERRSCLVVAAHPDDETFGCGATILRKTAAGTPVKVLIAADGRNANPTSTVLSPEELGAVRRAESAEVARLLGVPDGDLIQLEHENLRSAERLDDVRRRLREVVEEFRPDEILVNSDLDYHPDHRAVSQLVHELVDDGTYRGQVAEFPVWYLFDGPWTMGDEALAERPTTDDAAPATGSAVRRALRSAQEPVASVMRLKTAKVATGAYRVRKRAAIAAYRSQVTNYTGEETWGYLRDNFVSLFDRPHELFFAWERPRSGGE